MTIRDYSPNCPTLRGTNKKSLVTPLPEKSTLKRDRPGVEIEGFPKGGKRRGHRVPRDIRQSGNKYDIAAGQLGMFRCPYLGMYCSGKSAVDVRKCKGYEECHIRLTNKLVDRTWQRIRNESN